MYSFEMSLQKVTDNRVYLHCDIAAFTKVNDR